MSSITDTYSNSNTIDLRALLESGQSIDHLPNAFKQMHNYIKKLEAQNKELKEEIKLKDEIISLHEACGDDVSLRYLGSGELGRVRAGEYMSKNDKNILCIKNFSDNEDEYRIDGGKESLDNLSFEDYEEEDLKDIEFYAEK